MSSDAFLERCKFFREHVQTVLNLATGSLVLSVTFLGDRTGLTRLTSLKLAWGGLLLSVLLGVAYNYVLSIHVRMSGARFGGTLDLLSVAFHATFVAGVAALVWFALGNVG